MLVNTSGDELPGEASKNRPFQSVDHMSTANLYIVAIAWLLIFAFLGRALGT